MRRAAVAVAAVGLAIALYVVWLGLDPGPLRRIVVSNVVPRQTDFWQIAIDDSGAYRYTHGAVEDRGRIAFAPFAERLASIPWLRVLPSANQEGIPGFLYWIEGKRRTLAPFGMAEGGFTPALRDVATSLREAVVEDVRRRNAPVVDALTSLRDLRAVEAASKGCFGPCGVYTITFRADGTGELLWREPGAETVRRSRHVEWRRVRALLHEAHVERLERKYPSNVTDTQSAAMRFVFRRFQYGVEAPDRSSWPQEFRDAFREMRRLAAASDWTPPLSPYQSERLGS